MVVSSVWSSCLIDVRAVDPVQVTGVRVLGGKKIKGDPAIIAMVKEKQSLLPGDNGMFWPDFINNY